MRFAAQILSAVAATAAPAQEGAFELALGTANAIQLAALENHVEWCQENRAYAERDQAWQRVLDLDPEHRVARRALGYTWDRKAQIWTSKATRRSPRASATQLAERAGQRLAELDEQHLKRVRPLLDPEGGGTVDQRLVLLRELLRTMPLHPDLLERKGYRQGEVAETTLWLLAEQWHALARNPEVADLVQRIDGAWTGPIANAGPSRDGEFGMEWKLDLESQGVRLFVAGSDAEAQSILRTCVRTWDFTSALFGTKQPADQTVYVAVRAPKRRALLLAMAEGDQARFERLQGLVGDRKGKRVCIWAGGAPERLDAACRQTIAIQLGRRFGIGTRHGWITEGFGMALCEQLLGTRLTYFVSTGRYASDSDREVDDRLREPDSDWLALARQALEPARRPQLAYLLGRDVNGLGATDLVISYALARFLLEGHPPETTRTVLERIGAGQPPATVLEEELGYGLVLLAERLYDYLRPIHHDH